MEDELDRRRRAKEVAVFTRAWEALHAGLIPDERANEPPLRSLDVDRADRGDDDQDAGE